MLIQGCPFSIASQERADESILRVELGQLLSYKPHQLVLCKCFTDLNSPWERSVSYQYTSIRKKQNLAKDIDQSIILLPEFPCLIVQVHLVSLELKEALY